MRVGIGLGDELDGGADRPQLALRTTKKSEQTKKPAKPARVEFTKAQLTKAAKMRDDGATWNAIREAFGVKLGSSAWFRRWEQAGIPHRPAGEAKSKPTSEQG